MFGEGASQPQWMWDFAVSSLPSAFITAMVVFKVGFAACAERTTKLLARKPGFSGDLGHPLGKGNNAERETSRNLCRHPLRVCREDLGGIERGSSVMTRPC